MFVYKPSEEEQKEFQSQYEVSAKKESAVPVYRIPGSKEKVAWLPQKGRIIDPKTGKLRKGSQEQFMSCSLFEALFHGTRGPGKTDSLLMTFAQHVGRGHGKAWRGIIFRQTYPQLADIQAKSEKWFKLIFGKAAKFNKSKMMWEWDTGEVLLFRHMNKPSDYWNYHGHEYPFIGWEELTNWSSDECYKSMFSCCRTSTHGVPRMIRATTNPYGPGHHWIKDRFRLHQQWWKLVIVDDAKDESGRLEPTRCAIHGHIDENQILLSADPNYKQTIIASASNPAMADAWLRGSWDIVAGGMFGDIWEPSVHVLSPFNIPDAWRIDRSFDWGSTKPFSVGWWAVSDGSDVQLANGKWMSTVKGDLFRIAEWYGWNGKPNKGIIPLASDITKGIIEREIRWGIHGRVKNGVADSAIFSAENGNCIATDMAQPVKLSDGTMHKGIQWIPADKRPGSRKTGWEQCRKALANAKRPKVGIREHPGMFVFDNCKQFLRTFPSLPRDEKDMDDVDTNAEDHVGDETRYRVRLMNITVGTGKTIGYY